MVYCTHSLYLKIMKNSLADIFVYKIKNSYFVDFNGIVFKINISIANKVLSRILNDHIIVKSEKELYMILKDYFLYDETFLSYISFKIM